MERLFDNGGVALVVLGVLAAEAAILAVRRPGPRRAALALDLAFAFGPGICLLLALRAALVDAPWTSVALWLALSFPLHLGDVFRRRL